ncbi:MAG: OmpH family outer membrane protein [Candidatus Omnitrophota bacterium]
MKKLYFMMISIVVLGLMVQSVSAEEMKIAYINLAKIFDTYTKVADSNAELEKVKTTVKAKLDGIKKLQEGFDTLSDEAKEERKNQILAIQEDIRSNTMDIRKDEDRILREILKDIENISVELRKKKKLTYIIDDRLIIDGPKDMDITDEIVDLLNKRYKKDN